MARSRAVNSMVVALSFLHLREARQAPTSMALGKRLSSRQWSVVRRLERMLDAWIIHHLVTSESMGRNVEMQQKLKCNHTCVSSNKEVCRNMEVWPS